MAGTSGLTIAEWVSRQKLVRTADIVQATGFTYAHISKVANDNSLKPESKGRWRLETVAQLLKALGRLAKCPNCKGVAGLDRQGEATCLECEVVCPPEIKRQMHEGAMSFAQSDVCLIDWKEEANGDIVAEWQMMETAELLNVRYCADSGAIEVEYK